MEAFLLAERIITEEHMSSAQKGPKYLKKYDIPPSTPKTSIRTSKTRKPFQPIALLNVPRTKDLLTQLNESRDKTEYCHSSTKIDKYFTLSSQGYRDIGKKEKSALLVRTVHPRSQQYDADFAPVSRRAPCWAFLPEHSQHKIASPASSQTCFPKKSRTEHKKQRNRRRGQACSQNFEREVKVEASESNNRPETDSKLGFSAAELGRCTVQIFKKYHLDKDCYFKKLLAGMEQ